jgi:phage N-6-adenine-methyltransferase
MTGSAGSGKSYKDVAHSSASDEWSTPQDLVDELAAEFAPNGFTLDPAASDANHKAPHYYTQETDGLSRPWFGRVFLNPPFSHRQIGAWMTKAQEEVESGRAELVVCLVPARPDTQWWRSAVESAAVVRFLPSRITYGSVDGGGDRAPFGSALIVYGGQQDPGHCPYCATL